jgi:hypothetical protein
VFGINFSADRKDLVAATYGRGVWVYPLAASGTSAKLPPKPSGPSASGSGGSLANSGGSAALSIAGLVLVGAGLLSRRWNLVISR